jgi:hypothetical protein|uniref:Uncharacterized protein n=1 Tax=viral metagenome TaxID=1070528 RepID=A0A6C0AL94_9ZZZZ
MRKTTLFIITFLTLFAYVNANTYQNGFILGYVTRTMSKRRGNTNNKDKFIKYNKQIIDTRLFDFPQQKSPQCIEIKIKELKYIKLTFLHKLTVTIIVALGLLIPIHTCLYGNDNDRDRLLGVIVGSTFAQL